MRMQVQFNCRNSRCGLVPNRLCTSSTFAYDRCQGVRTLMAGMPAWPHISETGMDPIEKAIRNALEKGDPLDPGFRERVYHSAEQALSKSLAMHQGMDPAERHARIERLRRIAVLIEQEFEPAAEPVRPEPAPARRAPEPEPYRPPSPAPASDPDRMILSPQPVKQASKRTGSRKPGPLIGIFVFVTFFALVVMFGWVIWSSGIIDVFRDGGTIGGSANSASNSGGNPGDLGAGNPEEGWISVFSPADAGTLDTSNGISAELNGSGNEAYVLLKPGEQSGRDSAVSIEFGKGLLDTFRGRNIIINIEARAATDEIVQMSVGCDLAGAGTCQRTRFGLENQVTDNLLSVKLDDVSPEASGSISIVPDIDGKGRAIELYSIRVRADEETAN